MFIDEIQAMQERGEQLRKLSDGATDEEWAHLQRQLGLLDAKCPSYDVFNVFSTLNPSLIKGDSPVAANRNAEALERRDDLMKIAAKAPMGPPWFAFSLEHRLNERQRIAYLVRAVDENGEAISDLELWHRRFVVTAMFDSSLVPGRVEYNPNAIEILLNDDDEFASFQYDSRLSDVDLNAAKQGAGVVRTCIQLLNWDRNDVPTQMLVNRKQQKGKNGTGKDSGNGGRMKSDPTVIKFEPFLKAVRSGTHRGCANGTHSSPGQHLRKGGYANYRYEAPLLGHKPVLGRTYGRIWRAPCVVGNPEHGKLKAPRGVIKIGNVTDPNGSQQLIPFPASGEHGRSNAGGESCL